MLGLCIYPVSVLYPQRLDCEEDSLLLDWTHHLILSLAFERDQRKSKGGERTRNAE